MYYLKHEQQCFIRFKNMKAYSSLSVFRPDKTCDASVLNSFKIGPLEAVRISLYTDHNLSYIKIIG